MQLQNLNFQFSQLEYISKNENEKNRWSGCCYSIPPPRIRQILRSYFLMMYITTIFLLHCLSHKYGHAVSHRFRWNNLPLNQNKLRMPSFLSNLHMATMFEARFLRLVHLCDWKLFHLVKQLQWLTNFYDCTDHLQQFRTDKLSSFFKSEAFEFIQFWPETLQHIKRFLRPFCL